MSTAVLQNVWTGHVKILYAEGPGDIIQAYRFWMNRKDDPSQMSLTFSGEFADFCRESCAED